MRGSTVPSWQARLTNFALRNVVKRRFARAGFSQGSVGSAVSVLEWALGGFREEVASRVTLAGVPCDVLRPLGSETERLVLLLHGGGFCVHLPRTYRRFARMLAEASRATVFVPEYRLAPEHRFPAATDDSLAVYRALLAAGWDPRRLALVGDSAGGNLVLATLLRARDEGLPLPACAVAISPAADLTLSSGSFTANAEADPLVPAAILGDLASQYADETELLHPYASPMLGDFASLPPLHIIVGSTEVLLDSALGSGDAARKAGVAIELRVWDSMPHAFPLLPFLPESRRALRDAVRFIVEMTGPQCDSSPPRPSP
jgi:acetyl esterase/lipase